MKVAVFARVKYYITITLVVFVIGAITACAPPSLAARNALLGAGHSVEVVGKRVDEFHRALYWGDVDLAMTFVDPDERRRFRSIARDLKESERLVEVEVQGIDIDESVEIATVDVQIKYFKIPNYVVEKRVEKQVWLFDRQLGEWLYRNASRLKNL